MEYVITAKQNTFKNPTSNAILERIHLVVGNLVQTCYIKQTYAEEDDPWSGILYAA